LTTNKQKASMTDTELTKVNVLKEPDSGVPRPETLAFPVPQVQLADQGVLGLPPKPVRPTAKRLVVGDITTEALTKILSENPRGLLRFSDELTGFIRSMNAYRGGRGSDRQFYLSCWSGEDAQVDRKSEDERILISDPFLTVFGGIQPELLTTLEDERGRQDGFLHRFLFSFPKEPGRRVWDKSKGMSRRARETWEAVVNWLLALAMEEPGPDEPDRTPQPRTLTFSDEAERLWAEWHGKHWDETEWDCFPPHLRGVWSKFETHALVLVLVAHMLKVACEHALTGKAYDQRDPQIDADSVRRGLALADYFKDHNVRVFSRLKVEPNDLKAEALLKWVRKRPGKRASVREVQQNGVAGIKTASEARAALRNLEDRGWGEVRAEPSKVKGRKAEFFQAA
jgi:hypothetical protein